MCKWKLSYDAYKDKLPTLYNDYLNSFFKYLNVNSLTLPETTTIYKEKLPQAFAKVNEIRK